MLRDIPSGKLRELPNETAVNVKDRLRDIRDFIRAHRHDRLSGGAARPGNPAGDPLEGLLGHAASMVDDTLSLAESVSNTLLARGGSEGPQPLRVYFPAGAATSWRGERAFRHDMYAAAKRASSAFRLEADGLREAVFSAAHSATRRRHAPLLSQDIPATRRQYAARIAAALTLELRQAAAADSGLRMGESQDAAFIRRYVPGLLCSALATLDPEIAREPELFELALLATEAREDRIAAALAEKSLDTLSDVFASLLTHLP